VLPRAITAKLLQSIPGWHTQVIERLGGIDHDELTQHGSLNVGRIATDTLPTEQTLRISVPEAPDHRVKAIARKA
jgi:hypothetical protein